MKLAHWALVISLSIVVSAAPAFARRGHGERHGGRHGISHFDGFVHHTHHIIEGLVLGSIIGSVITNATPEREIIYSPEPRATHRTFRLESNGECFLVSQNSTGDRVLTKVPVSNCN